MSNHQILEIVLEALFFATVAAVAVIFAIIRERAVRKSVSAEMQSKNTKFSSVMDRATACMPTPEDFLSPGPGARRRVIDRLSRPTVSVAREREESPVKITRAERELISSLAEDGSRQGA